MIKLKSKTILLVLVVFLLFNIVYSQNISSLYPSFADEDKTSSVLFLKTIRSLPDFNGLLSRYESIFDKSIVGLVYKDERQRKTQIEKLNQALEKNPKAKEVLSALSKLYKEDGNELKAEEFFKKTKAIDPLTN